MVNMEESRVKEGFENAPDLYATFFLFYQIKMFCYCNCAHGEHGVMYIAMQTFEQVTPQYLFSCTENAMTHLYL